MTNSNVIKETYLKLALAVVSCMIAGYLAINIPWLVAFMQTPLGWLVGMLAINLITPMCLFVADNPDEGFFSYIMLSMQGIFSGIAVCPLLYLASHVTNGAITGEQLIISSIGLTAAIFALVTAYTFYVGKFWDPGEAMMGATGLIVLGIIPLNAFVLHSGLLGYVILLLVGLIGAFQLIKGTNEVIEAKENNSNRAALIIFAGVFNLFQVLLISLFSLFGYRR